MNEFKDEINILLTKLISISSVFIGIGLKIMHNIQKKKFVLLNAIFTTFCGVGLALALSPILSEKLSNSYYTVSIAFLGIAGDKIVEVVMLKIEDKNFLSDTWQMIRNYLFKK